ncbi:LRR receptor-like serine/threonine-protein kinase EFR [Miscanthus floridulus]|uniref:LRR receptor-like serine/threonine-protein kinase EFR n=1 Tax=Miscanthus floridulus TaxID=154761 RepID=UPI003459E5BC
MAMLLTLLLLSYGVSNARCSTIPDNSTDMLALLDFKQAVTDPRGALSTWNSSIPHCQWEGVNCSRKHLWRVTVLSLVGLGLAGPISPSIGNLTFLETLNLSLNSLSGELPPLNRFHKLQQLVLAKNSLQGIIPDTLTNCSNLNFLDLSENSLIGEIPLGIGLLSNLSTLFLYENNLTGMIPPSLTNISGLSSLALGDNQLMSSIPDELWQLPHLLYLALGGNKLSGGITAINRSSLRGLDLSNNMIGNTLPSDIGDMLPNIVFLFLCSNSFEGKIPASLGNISGLQELDLLFNNFTGQVPSSLGKHGMLTSLSLLGNNLVGNDSQSWQFIDTLSNCSFLQSLILSQNQFQGAIPNSISKLSPKLQQLAFGTNDLTGTVPTGIGNLTGLTELEVRYNNLNGQIDGWVGNLKNLQGQIDG